MCLWPAALPDVFHWDLWPVRTKSVFFHWLHGHGHGCQAATSGIGHHSTMFVLLWILMESPPQLRLITHSVWGTKWNKSLPSSSSGIWLMSGHLRQSSFLHGKPPGPCPEGPASMVRKYRSHIKPDLFFKKSEPKPHASSRLLFLDPLL